MMTDTRVDAKQRKKTVNCAEAIRVAHAIKELEQKKEKKRVEPVLNTDAVSHAIITSCSIEGPGFFANCD